MDNTSDNEKKVRGDRGSDSSHSSSDSEHGGSGEAAVQVHSPVQVHAPADEERSSPDYMETRDREERSRSSSSSSSSDDEQEKPKVEVEATPAVEPLEEVNGEAHDGSRRSSSSSASSASPSDPCDDPPNPPSKDDGVDGLLLALKQQDSVEHSAVTLDKVTVDAPADPSQPLITLFVKVRHVQRFAPPEQTAFSR